MRTDRTSAVFLDLARAIVHGDIDDVRARVRADAGIASMPAPSGAARSGAPGFFLREIRHYVYAGDTALHIAAAAFNLAIAELLVAHGADCRARNRMGAEPLHYACDTNHWSPDAQAAVIAYLISIGADPNALDKRGVAPLHRAVRTRSAPAVRALLDGGADSGLANKNGSLAVDLARRTTGRGGSSSEHARAQQAAIIELLTGHGGRNARRRRHA
jgi:Ankyrin repeats (many copies)/Ankyrin repeats (3 copies)